MGGLESELKSLCFTVIDRDGQLDFACGLADSSGNSTKQVDQSVVGRSEIQIIIEITESILKGRWDEAIANVHG